MSVFYGKVRIYGEPGQTITITDGKGNSRTVQTTGTTYTDIALPGMEEYTLSNGVHSADILLNIGDFKEVTISVPTLEELTWTQVKSSIQDGTFAQFASVGDTKSFVMNGKTYHAEVVAINDGTGDAASWYPDKTVDFICTELYETAYQYNSTNDNTGGFPSSALRGTLINTLYPLLPSELKDVIIEKSHSYNTSTSGTMSTDSTKLWLPTQYEISGATATYAPGETASNNKKIHIGIINQNQKRSVICRLLVAWLSWLSHLQQLLECQHLWRTRQRLQRYRHDWCSALLPYLTGR